MENKEVESRGVIVCGNCGHTGKGIIHKNAVYSCGVCNTVHTWPFDNAETYTVKEWQEKQGKELRQSTTKTPLETYEDPDEAFKRAEAYKLTNEDMESLKTVFKREEPKAVEDNPAEEEPLYINFLQRDRIKEFLEMDIPGIVYLELDPVQKIIFKKIKQAREKTFLLKFVMDDFTETYVAAVKTVEMEQNNGSETSIVVGFAIIASQVLKTTSADEKVKQEYLQAIKEYNDSKKLEIEKAFEKAKKLKEWVKEYKNTKDGRVPVWIPMKKEAVNSPSHYQMEINGQNLEAIDIMKAVMTPEQMQGLNLGNVIKYILRAEKKNGLEDYKKARYYLDELIKAKEQEGSGQNE